MRAVPLLAALLVLPGAPLAGQATPAGPPAAASVHADAEREGYFWGVLAGVGAGKLGCEQFSARLGQVLARMPDDDLRRFAEEWAAWWAASYRWDLWGAAYIINGGASDDGFDYFRGWLLTRGGERYARAIADPDAAFDDVAPGTEAECEDVVTVLPNAYEERFGEEAPDLGAREPAGARWTEDDLPRRFPRLTRRFGEQ